MCEDSILITPSWYGMSWAICLAQSENDYRIYSENDSKLVCVSKFLQWNVSTILTIKIFCIAILSDCLNEVAEEQRYEKDFICIESVILQILWTLKLVHGDGCEFD